MSPRDGGAGADDVDVTSSGSAGLPAWIVSVRGHRLPRQVAGHPALELCNTHSDCGGPGGHDYLVDLDTTIRWAGHSGLLDDQQVAAARAAASTDVEPAHQVLARLRSFRTALWHVLVDPSPRDHDRTLVTEVVEEAVHELRLELERRPRLTFADSTGVRLPLLASAGSAADLLTSADRPRVRQCSGQDCGWLFLDRTGRRRWCLMATCGNRAKARRYAERRRST